MHSSASQPTVESVGPSHSPFVVSQSHDPGFHPGPEYEEIKHVYRPQWCGERASREAGGQEEGYKLTECPAYATASTV